MINVVHKRPGLPAEVVSVEGDLESLRALLDGGYLEAVQLNDLHIYCDEEGLLKNLPVNLSLNGQNIRGPIIISKCDAEGEEIGITDEGKARALCRTVNANTL